MSSSVNKDSNKDSNSGAAGKLQMSELQPRLSNETETEPSTTLDFNTRIEDTEGNMWGTMKLFPPGEEPTGMSAFNLTPNEFVSSMKDVDAVINADSAPDENSEPSRDTSSTPPPGPSDAPSDTPDVQKRIKLKLTYRAPLAPLSNSTLNQNPPLPEKRTRIVIRQRPRCDFCHKPFKEANLVRHRNRIHNPDSAYYRQGTPVPGGIPCDVLGCEYSAKNERQLKNHMSKGFHGPKRGKKAAASAEED